MDARGLLVNWAYGWSLPRGRRLPAPVAGGVRIDLGVPSRAVRFVLPGLDRLSIARLGRGWTAVGTEVKTLSGWARLRACVGDGWSMYPACELMTIEFTARPGTLPGGYTARMSADGATIVATVLDGDNALASSARLARWGRYGIVDQVETSARHRRLAWRPR